MGDNSPRAARAWPPPPQRLVVVEPRPEPPRPRYREDLLGIGLRVSGIALDGASWFYTNPLRFYAREHKLLSQDAYERFQPARPPAN